MSFFGKIKKMRLENPYNNPCLTIPSLFSRYVSSSKTVFAFLMISEERDDNDDDNDDNTETPDPVQAQIPSHPGIKYRVSGTPHFDLKFWGFFQAGVSKVLGPMGCVHGPIVV